MEGFAIMDIELPDGTVLSDIPDGTTKEQIIAKMQSGGMNIPKEWMPTQEPAQERDLTESVLRKAALTGKAAYKGLTAIPGLAGEAVAMPYNLAARGINYFGANLPESHPSRGLNAIGEKLYPVTPETSGERVSEDVISAVGSGGGMLGVANKLAPMQGVTGKIGASMMANPSLQLAGAATSGLAAGTARESGSGQGGQIAAGLAGALTPYAATSLYNASRSITSPVYKSISVLSEGGKKLEAEDILKKLAGNEPAHIKAALESRSTYLQGQKPTTAEALAQYKASTGETVGSGLVKLQTTLAKLPESSNKLQTINTKRLNTYGDIIGKIAGTPEKKLAYENARTAATKKLYAAADETLTPVDDNLKNIIARMPSESIAAAKELAKGDTGKLSQMADFDSSGAIAINGKMLRNMLKGLDIRANDMNLDSAIRRSAQNISDDLYKVLEKTNPAAIKADRVYAQLSRPINRMEIGNILASKLKNASQSDTLPQFLNAGDDAAKTIKNASGMSGLKTFEQIMTKKEINAINAVTKDMERMLETARISGKSTLPNAGTLAETAQLNVPSLLSRPVAFTKWALSFIGKDVSPEINKILGETLADPQKLAIILKNSPKDKIPAILAYAKEFAKGGIPAGAVTLQGQE